MNERPTKVSELLKSPENWTTGSYARNSENEKVSVAMKDDGACKWCLVGGIYAIYGFQSAKAMEVRTRIQQFLNLNATNPDGTDGVLRWNDDPHREFEDVRNLVLSLDI